MSGFSALQRAENSSIPPPRAAAAPAPRFQCSSASRKFLNVRSPASHYEIPRFQCSSASRKFLNSKTSFSREIPTSGFQCSSASRKFLNRRGARRVVASGVGFSALQRAENSSIAARLRDEVAAAVSFSALQRAENSSINLPPHFDASFLTFQCSSASRKFLNCYETSIG